MHAETGRHKQSASPPPTCCILPLIVQQPRTVLISQPSCRPCTSPSRGAASEAWAARASAAQLAPSRCAPVAALRSRWAGRRLERPRCWVRTRGSGGGGGCRPTSADPRALTPNRSGDLADRSEPAAGPACVLACRSTNHQPRQPSPSLLQWWRETTRSCARVRSPGRVWGRAGLRGGQRGQGGEGALTALFPADVLPPAACCLLLLPCSGGGDAARRQLGRGPEGGRQGIVSGLLGSERDSACRPSPASGG